VPYANHWSDEMTSTTWRHVTGLYLAVALCSAAASWPAHAAKPSPGAYTGTLHGALYRIDVPANWNGDLVMLVHGYQPVGAPVSTPMTAADSTPVLLKKGFAVAQSQYASQGWAVSDAIADTERLRQYFVKTYVMPSHTYIYGFSLGGLEVAASIERYPHTYAGAMITCGLTVSTPDFLDQGTVTPLVAFDALIPGVIPDLAAPDSPPAIPPDTIAKALEAHPNEAATLAKRLEERPETLPTLALYYMVLREFEKRAGGMPVDNRKEVYEGFGDDIAFNRKVHRYSASPQAMAYAKQNVTLTGQIETPLVMQWNAFDQTIPARFHGVYPAQIKAAGSAKWLTVLDPVGDGHCDFTDEQTAEAFDTLVRKAGANL
jgi:poly(3-hydroxybutyrate) depolymerase